MARQLITFHLGTQSFGLDIMAIREIRAWTPAASLPQVPDYVAGVVNLRGTILPVVDLAARLGWAATQASPRHAIIVTQVAGQARGLIVDSVSDIVTIAAEDLQPPPTLGQDGVIPFLEGLAAVEDRMVMVLDLAAINADEAKALAA